MNIHFSPRVFIFFVGKFCYHSIIYSLLQKIFIPKQNTGYEYPIYFTESFIFLLEDFFIILVNKWWAIAPSFIPSCKKYSFLNKTLVRNTPFRCRCRRTLWCLWYGWSLPTSRMQCKIFFSLMTQNLINHTNTP